MNETARRRRSSTNRRLAGLLTALNAAVEPDAPRPWAGVRKFLRRDSFRARTRIVTDDEIAALKAAADPDLVDLVTVPELTGARVGEITGAKVGGYDRHARTLTLAGKTGERTIALHPALVPLMSRYSLGRKPKDHLLRQADGTPWQDTHASRFRAARQAAGLPDDLVAYMIRHRAISKMIAKGMPATQVAQYCGTSLERIEASYGHFAKEEVTAWLTQAL